MTSPNFASTEPSSPDAALINAWKWTINGHNKADVLEAIQKQHPDQDPREIIVAAYQALAVSAAEPKELVDGFCMEALRSLYRKFLDVGDLAGALAAIREIAKMNAANGKAKPLPEYLSALTQK